MDSKTTFYLAGYHDSQKEVIYEKGDSLEIYFTDLPEEHRKTKSIRDIELMKEIRYQNRRFKIKGLLKFNLGKQDASVWMYIEDQG